MYYNSYIDTMKCYQWCFILVYHMKSIVNNDSIRNMRVYDRCIVPIEDKQTNKQTNYWPAGGFERNVHCLLRHYLTTLNFFPLADFGVCLLSLYATYHIEWVVHSKCFARILLLPHNLPAHLPHQKTFHNQYTVFAFYHKPSFFPSFLPSFFFFLCSKSKHPYQGSPNHDIP